MPPAPPNASAERWLDRFKCQSLLDDNAVLAAMAYVDLNPVRAKICDTLEASAHTSARQRLTDIEQDSASADRPLAPVAGIRGMCVLRMTQAEYLSLLDYTGRQIRADKRGAIKGQPAVTLARLGYHPETWTRQVLAVKSDFSRAMGAVECLVVKAAEMGQCWLRGIATARWLGARQQRQTTQPVAERSSRPLQTHKIDATQCPPSPR